MAAALDRYIKAEQWADERSDHQLALCAAPAAEAQRRADIAAAQGPAQANAIGGTAHEQPGAAAVAYTTASKGGSPPVHTAMLPPKLPHSVAWRHTTSGSERVRRHSTHHSDLVSVQATKGPQHTVVRADGPAHAHVLP